MGVAGQSYALLRFHLGSAACRPTGLRKALWSRDFFQKLRTSRKREDTPRLRPCTRGSFENIPRTLRRMKLVQRNTAPGRLIVSRLWPAALEGRLIFLPRILKCSQTAFAKPFGKKNHVFWRT